MRQWPYLPKMLNETILLIETMENLGNSDYWDDGLISLKQWFLFDSIPISKWIVTLTFINEKELCFSLAKELVDHSNLSFFLIETIVINGTMTFSSIISNRDDGFGLRRWSFYQLIVKRNVTLIRQVRVLSKVLY